MYHKKLLRLQYHHGLFLIILILIGCSSEKTNQARLTQISMGNHLLTQEISMQTCQPSIFPILSQSLTPSITMPLSGKQTPELLDGTKIFLPSQSLTPTIFPFVSIYGPIAFATGRNIGIIDQYGNRKTLIEECYFCRMVTWSPDGRYLAFDASFEIGGFSQLYTVNVETGAMQQITTGPHPKSFPSWSQNGEYIAYVEDIGSSADIVIVSVDGNYSKKITYTPGFEYYPNWSPAGDIIAFVYKKDRFSDDPAELWVMDRDGKNRHQIIQFPVDFNPISFSPDGKQIAFTSGNEYGELYIVGLDGSNLKKLITLRGQVTAPTWSSDGKYLLFLRRIEKRSTTNEDSQVYIEQQVYSIKPDGSELAQLVSLFDDLSVTIIVPNPIWKK